MVTNIVNLIVECIKLLLVMCGILNYKFRKSAAAIILLVLSIIALIILGIINNDYQVSLFIIVTVFICFLSVEGNRKTLLCFLSFFAICCIDEFLVLILKIILSISDETLRSNTIAGSIANSVSLILLMIVSMALQHFYYKKRNPEKQSIRNSSILYIMLFLIGQMTSLIISSFYADGYKDTLRNSRIVAISVCMWSMLFLVLGILLIYNNNSKKRYKQVAEINKKLLESQQNYYQMLLDKETETRKFRHDISNHILCVDTLLKEKEYDEAADYLASLRASLSDLKPKYQTGNILVNAIVNDISNKYKNVNFSWQGMFPQNLWISNMDLCVIFSNVLENAFYAASVCSERRNVRVDIKSVSNSIMILVENDISAPVDESKGKLLTQKADKKNHGFGTMNVRACVNTNGGSVEYKYTDKVFTVEIVLPNVVQ